MGSITEAYANLCDVILAESRSHKSSDRDLFLNYVVRPLLLSAFRVGTGQIVDVKDRALGPFDVIGCSESYPPMGEGLASQFLMDGVAFCIQVRNWKEEDLTQFADMAGKLKAMVRRNKQPVVCAVVGFESLPAAQVVEFLKSSSGHHVDAVLSVGQHLILRNTQGWYGDVQRIPLVSEKGPGESLRSFSFWLMHLMQTFLGVPYPLNDYQHL